MHKILILTDLHITGGDPIIGLDPFARARASVEHSLADHPDAACLIITGDLTHYGTAAEYNRLETLLSGIRLPVHLTLGNHDNRAAFCTAFPGHTDQDGFAQKIIDLPGWRLVLLDTLDDAPTVKHAGILCRRRLDFLDAALAQAGDRRKLVLMHHPPFDTGFKGMDAIKLANGPETTKILAHHGVEFCVAGHVHRTISGSADGLPFAIFKSPCHQMPMLLNEDGSAHSVDEPGAYGLLLLDETGVIALTEDIIPGRVAGVDGHSA